MTESDDNSAYGPEGEVWSYLWSGIDMANDELRALTPESRKAIEWLAQTLVEGRTQLTHQSRSTEQKLISIDDVLLSDPWVRHATEIEVASLGVERAQIALKRYLQLRPIVTKRPIPLRAAKYVAEVVNTFAFGFDAACIALCRATMEQVLKDELVRRGAYTEAIIKQKRLTAGKLIDLAKKHGLLRTSMKAAYRLSEKADTVMHNFIYEDKIKERQTLDSISQLLSVMGDLLGKED